MGCFDTVSVNCPHCCAQNLLQTKSGKCRLQTYTAGNAPTEVIAGVLGAHYCRNCRKRFAIEAVTYVKIVTKEREHAD